MTLKRQLVDKTQAAVSIFNRYAAQYQEKYMEQPAYHAALSLFVRLLPGQEPSILDVACGPGNVTQFLLSKVPAAKVLGIDLSEQMLKLARVNNPHTDFRNHDARDIRALSGSFFGIVCAFCLPYLSKTDSIQFIVDAAAMLPPSGVLYLSTMEGSYADSSWQGPSSGGTEKLYIHYHEASYLQQTLLDNGLLIQHEERIVSDAPNGETDLVLVAQKKDKP